MTTNELYLKTVFSCIACDCDIAPEEVDLVRNLSNNNEAIKNIDVEALLNKWRKRITSNNSI